MLWACRLGEAQCGKLGVWGIFWGGSQSVLMPSPGYISWRRNRSSRRAMISWCRISHMPCTGGTPQARGKAKGCRVHNTLWFQTTALGGRGPHRGVPTDIAATEVINNVTLNPKPYSATAGSCNSCRLTRCLRVMALEVDLRGCTTPLSVSLSKEGRITFAEYSRLLCIYRHDMSCLPKLAYSRSHVADVPDSGF